MYQIFKTKTIRHSNISVRESIIKSRFILQFNAPTKFTSTNSCTVTTVSQGGALILVDAFQHSLMIHQEVANAP